MTVDTTNFLERKEAEIMCMRLNDILTHAADEIVYLRGTSPAGPIKGHLSDYLQTFLILKRSARALIEEARNE